MSNLTIAYDTWTEGHAIYIDGILRGEWNESCFNDSELIECYQTFAAEQPVVLERIEVSSHCLGIHIDDCGVQWPEQLGGLFATT